jgi:hypothetical protein
MIPKLGFCLEKPSPFSLIYPAVTVRTLSQCGWHIRGAKGGALPKAKWRISPESGLGHLARMRRDPPRLGSSVQQHWLRGAQQIGAPTGARHKIFAAGTRCLPNFTTFSTTGSFYSRSKSSSAERPSVGGRGPWEFGRRCRYLSYLFRYFSDAPGVTIRTGEVEGLVPF